MSPSIIKRIPHVTIKLTNKEYNDRNEQNINMNKIKAILHNKALYQLLNKDNYKYDLIVMDEFANKYVYFNYLKEVNNVIRNITFTTKAEDKCLSVACASIISRYIFLKEMKELSKKLGIEIPKGAGAKVDLVGKKIIKKYGEDLLRDIAKLNFKNTEKIKNLE